MVECPDDGDDVVWAGGGADDGRCDDDEGSDSKCSRASVLRRVATLSMPPLADDLLIFSVLQQRSSHC
jgi:hypothetical protein